MKSFRIFSKYDHILVLKRTDRKAQIQLKKGEEHIFNSAGEYKMYEKTVSIYLKSNKLGLEMIDPEANKPEDDDIQISDVQGADQDDSQDNVQEEDLAQAEEDAIRERQEAEDAKEDASEEEAEAVKAEEIRELKKRCNDLIRDYKATPKKNKEKRKELKDAIESIKSEISQLEG